MASFQDHETYLEKNGLDERQRARFIVPKELVTVGCNALHDSSCTRWGTEAKTTVRSSVLAPASLPRSSLANEALEIGDGIDIVTKELKFRSRFGKGPCLQVLLVCISRREPANYLRPNRPSTC
jgi:hypothetical protein